MAAKRNTRILKEEMIALLRMFDDLGLRLNPETKQNTLPEGVTWDILFVEGLKVVPRLNKDMLNRQIESFRIVFADEPPKLSLTKRVEALEKHIADLEAKLAAMAKPSNSLSGMISAQPLPIPDQLALKIPPTIPPRPPHQPWPNNKAKQ